MTEIFYMVFCLLFIVVALGVVLFLQFVSTLREYTNKAIIVAAFYYIAERLKK